MADRGWRPQLTAWVDRVDLVWGRMGVPAGERAELRAQLVRDLAQAVAEGAPLSELLDVDPARLAQDVVSSLGLTPVAPTAPAPAPPGRGAVARVVVGGLVGVAVGGLVSVLPVLAAMGWAFHHVPPGSARESAAILAAYAVAGLVTALAGGIGVSVACDDVPAPARPLRRGTLGLLASGAVATVLAVGYAATTGYSTAPGVVLTEVVLVVGVVVAGLALVGQRVVRAGG
ncbi:hypothetical protein G5V58_01875 [Nocardioides anomalus]|uniref:Uncharacterized protein n=1 Tax=Nocardioides anomalus TaxID=2712223 RepID=A0A6G6W9A7_9ACTN|nr:hypothetical protein [Nocardioides anomalus]QIG41685.1 hypothetical protein G5V58_01875 [Nocardioides anomalus]